MGDLARQLLTVEQFYEWVATQNQKYELVEGQPVLMAGANRRHDRIAANAIRVVGNHLQGHRCQPFTSDTYIRIPSGNRRQADMGVDSGGVDSGGVDSGGVDSGPFEDTSLEAAESTLVLEILSPTTRTFDRNDKLEEYKTVATLENILLVDPDQPQMRLYRRDIHRNWTSDRLAGPDAALDMPLLDLHLPLADLYAGLVFRPQPTLVDPLDNPASKFAI